MNEDQAKDWAKDKTNQNKVVAAFFKDNAPHEGKLAIFMAGIPGAGKTEFTENSIKEASPGLISIEHDKLVEYIDGYTPETYYNYRKAGSILVTRVLDECLSKGFSFVFDGTLSHENGIRNIDKSIRKGYAVVVVYLVQDAATAWELTQSRELVMKRSIERDGFLVTCNKINTNLLAIFRAYQENQQFTFLLIDKHGEPSTGKATAILHSPELNKSTEIEEALQKGYNIDTGK